MADAPTENNPDLPKKAKWLGTKAGYLVARDEAVAVKLGYPHEDPSLRLSAMRQMGQQRAQQAASPIGTGPAAAAAVTWTELGPAPIPNGQTQFVAVPVNGRVTSIAVHPTNANIVYVGTAQGGLYRSLDGGTNWTQLFDNAQSLAIGAIAIAPSSPSTVYVGTGEGNFSLDSFFGVGLYRIDNADTTATLVGPIDPPGGSGVVGANTFGGRSITKIVVHPTDAATIFVSTASGFSGRSGEPAAVLPNRGVFRSTNATAAAGTVSFTMLTVQSVPNRSVTDLVMDLTDPNLLVAWVFSPPAAVDGGPWRTTNALAATPTFTQTRAVSAVGKMALQSLGPNSVLVSGSDEPVVVGGNTVFGVLYKSTDLGRNVERSARGRSQQPGLLPRSVRLRHGYCDRPDRPRRYPCWRLIAWVYELAVHALRRRRYRLFVLHQGPARGHACDRRCALGPPHDLPRQRRRYLQVHRSRRHLDVAEQHQFKAVQFQSLATHPTDSEFAIGGTQDNGTELRNAARHLDAGRLRRRRVRADRSERDQHDQRHDVPHVLQPDEQL